MTFTISVKEEMSQNDLSLNETRVLVNSFIKYCGKIKNDIVLTLENGSVARKIYKDIKKVYDLSPLITIRNQKRFRIKQIYILAIKDKVNIIKGDSLIKYPLSDLPSDEEKIAYLMGAFLAVGNISNPQTSGYHMEFVCHTLKHAKDIKFILDYYNFDAKIIERGYKSVVYIKQSEHISDLIKYFKATNALFFFEDIRIYRDHKNMVNRLNNCEISNQTRALETGLKQMEMINYLKDNDLIELLDDKTKIVIEARQKYNECSLTELAEIITLEYNYKIGKSGVNHHFIKINNMVKRHRSNNENK